MLAPRNHRALLRLRFEMWRPAVIQRAPTAAARGTLPGGGVRFVVVFFFLKEKVARGFRGSGWCGVRFRFVPGHRHFSSELGVM